MGPDRLTRNISRRQWLKAGGRWLGLGLLGAVVGVLVDRRGSGSIRSLCEGCRFASADCRPDVDCVLDRTSPGRNEDK
jgi:hypothetical protein